MIDAIDGQTLECTSPSQGIWHDARGAHLKELDGCIDVDFTFTCFTNTLPVRRTGYEKGQARSFPDALCFLRQAGALCRMARDIPASNRAGVFFLRPPTAVLPAKLNSMILASCKIIPASITVSISHDLAKPRDPMGAD